MRFLLVFAVFLLLAGCVSNPSVDSTIPIPVQPSDTITIATFNLQAFGPTKAGNETVSNALARIIEQYDLIAIQEIRDVSGEAFPSLVARLNKPYSFVVSERLGSTVSKEQYAFIYDPTKVLLVGEPYVLNSSAFERPPFIAQFNVSGFDFFLVTIHTKPERGVTAGEINALADAINSTEDYILLGDFNADCDYISVAERTLLLPSLFWVVGSDEDTTVRNSTDCAYDRVVLTNNTIEDFSEYGVNRFAEGDGALAVSDHFPLWVKFFTDRDTD